MPNRVYNSGIYRYGFNGKEMDNEVKGIGNEIDYGLRVYDPRLVRFLSVDPLTKSYPYYTPYQYAGNKPIACIDLDGGEEKYKVTTDFRIQYKPVISTPNTGTAVNNAMHNTMTFIWNSTAGSALEAGKGAWNTTAETVTGNYQPSSWEVDPVGAFMDWTNDAWNYLFHTSAKQKVKDFVNTATNPASYELPAQLIIAHKLAVPEKAAVPFSGDIISARQRLATNWGVHSEYINFERQVYTKAIEEEEVLYQYRIPGTDAGSYYVKSLDIKPEDVGLSSADYTEAYKVTVQKRTTSLVSTHTENATYWRNKKITVRGGGLQAPVKLTTLRRFKLTSAGRCKLTTLGRSKLTT